MISTETKNDGDLNTQPTETNTVENVVTTQPIYFSSKSNEWETPSELYEKLNAEFGFTLDPCSTDENAKCERHFTIADNGLEQSWKYERVFMNPPYGREISKWMSKAYREGTTPGRADLVVCLIPAKTDTRYWHDYVIDKAEVRFIKGRLKISGAKYNAPFPSAIVIYRNNN